MKKMEDFEVEIFEGKSLNSLFKDIYDSSRNKQDEIYETITSLQNIIGTNQNHAIILAPVIVDFMDVSVKNDEQLIKLATVVQKIISSNKRNVDEDGNSIISESEKEKLLQMTKKEIKDVKEDEENIKDKIEELSDKVIDFNQHQTIN